VTTDAAPLDGLFVDGAGHPRPLPKPRRRKELPTAAAPARLVGPRHSREFVVEWIILAAGLAVVAVFLVAMNYGQYRATRASERERLQVQAQVIGDNVGQQLAGINRALAAVRDETLVTPAVAAETISARLRTLADAIPGISSMAVLDTDGRVIASSNAALLGRSLAERDYFRIARTARNSGTLHVASPQKTSFGNYSVVFARSIALPGGDFGGVVVAALEPSFLKVLLSSVLYAPDMWVALGHGDGKVFVTMPHDARRIETPWQRDASLLERAPSRSASARVVLGAVGGADEPRVTAMRTVSPDDLQMDQPLVISVSRSISAVLQPWRGHAVEYLALFVLLGGAAALLLQRGQTRRWAFAHLKQLTAEERLRSAEQLELALQGADLGLWDWDLRTDHFTQNDVTQLQMGYAPGELSQFASVWHELVHPEDSERKRLTLRAHFRGETDAYECEFRVRHKAGHWIWLLSRAKVTERDPSGRPLRVTGTHMDLSRRKRIETQVEHTAEMLHRTGELANIGGWELDLATGQLEWTEQVYRIHELEPGRMPRLEDTVSYYAPEARPTIQAAVEAGARDGTPWDLELPFVTATGQPRWVRSQGVAVIENGAPVRLLGAFQDITEKKTVALELLRLNEKLVQLSTIDALTGVGNRRLFDETLDTEWARAARRSEPLALLMIDLDHFKEYNDHYGHPAGDACLRNVARMIADAGRRGGELLARYGGEEFALLLPAADLASALQVAERCRQAVADAKIEHRASSSSAWLGISIGVASQIADAGVAAGVLVDIADAALYRAKRCGRGRIEF